MKKLLVPAAALCATAAIAGLVAPRTVESHTYEITVENLTTGQGFSTPVFLTHTSSMHFFEPGKKASLPVQRIAEEGNHDITLVTGLQAKKHGKVGDVQAGLPIGPGMSGTVRIMVDADHPKLSGAWMLGMTNDGFSGIDCVDAMAIGEERTMMLKGWDAGSEKNDERQANMIALMGPNRNPENGVIHPHTGIRGDKDAPKKWDFHGDVAKITIRRVE